MQPGDDVVAPVEGETEKIVGNKFIRTVTTTYERPTKDPVLADAITDFDGRAMFALHPNQVSNTAGFVVTTTTIESLRTGDVETTTSRRPVIERAADIFFKTSKFGDQTDTRGLPSGLTVNLRDQHLGTPDAPLTFAIRLSPPVHP